MSANVFSVSMKNNCSPVQSIRSVIPASHGQLLGSSSSLALLSGPLDHGFWRAVEEDELGVQVFLQVQFSRLSDQEDVGAELEDSVHVGKLFEHDGVRDPAEELSHELSDNQYHRHVQTHDPVHTQVTFNSTNHTNYIVSSSQIDKIVFNLVQMDIIRDSQHVCYIIRDIYLFSSLYLIELTQLREYS